MLRKAAWGPLCKSWKGNLHWGTKWSEASCHIEWIICISSTEKYVNAQLVSAASTGVKVISSGGFKAPGCYKQSWLLTCVGESESWLMQSIT